MGLFDFLKPLTKPPVQSPGTGKLPLLVRERIVHLEGRQVFAIIHNGKHFLTNMSIYQDGVVDCWECVDLATMELKVRQGWVTPQVPEGEDLSIFHLATVSIAEAQWTHTPENYMNMVRAVVKEMNPAMENILVASEQTSHRIGNTNYSRLGSSGAILRQDAGKPSFQQYRGNQMNIFYKHRSDQYYLVSLVIYADGKVLIVGGPEEWFVSRDEVLKWGAKGALCVSVPEGASLVIDRVGTIEVDECTSYVELADKMHEIDDMIAVLNKQPDSADRCATAFKTYEKAPTAEHRQALQAAYDAVPRHLRIYILGDMDEKDWPIRHALGLS